MKAIDIAFKDLISSFRSVFGVVNMFVIPLLVTTIFFFMFGGSSPDTGFSVSVTKVSLANLDAGSPGFAANAASFSGDASQLQGAQSLGEMVANTLQSPDLANLVEVIPAQDAAAAKAAVNSQQAGVAVIIPADFSAKFMQSGEQATLEMYSDPTLTIGPGIVRAVLTQLMDGLSGGKIAIEVAQQKAGTEDQALINQIMGQYMAGQNSGDNRESLMEVISPAPRDAKADLRLNILGPVMGAMLIFYAFFTGTLVAESILREEENRTLPRMFTTPTPHTTILTGKFLAVFLTVTVQVLVLLVAARLIFQIHWGKVLPVAITAGCTILAASCFGIFVNSFLKDTRQGGMIFGGVLSLTGMIGMLPIFAGFASGQTSWAQNVALLVPQGWAVRALQLSMRQAATGAVALSGLALLAWALVFFLIGVGRFGKRYI